MGKIFRRIYLNVKSLFLSYYYVACYSKGNLALRNKQYKKAAILFLKPLAYKDIEGCFLDHVFLKELRGTLYEQLGDIYSDHFHDYSKAINFYQQAAELNFRQLHVSYFKIAQLYDELNKIEEARNYYQAALEASPHKNFSCYYHLGDVLKREGNYQGAIQYFREAMQIEPQKKYWVQAQIGNIYNKNLENYAEAIKTIKQSLMEAGKGITAYIDNMYLSTLYWKKGDIESSLGALEEAIALNPKDASIAYEGAAQIYFTELKEYDKGVEMLQKAADINPHGSRVYDKLGMALLQEGRLEEAVLPLQQAVNLNSKEYLAYFALGFYHFKQQDYQKSYELFHQALALAPADAEIMENLTRYMAYSLKHIGYIIEARDYFEKVLEFYSKDKDAYYNLGIIYCVREKYDKGIQMMQRLVSFYPNESESYIKLGIGYELAEQYERAMVQYHHAISLNPNIKACYMGMARIFAYKRIWQRAIEYFQKALALDPQDVFLAQLIEEARKAMSGNYQAYQKVTNCLNEQKKQIIDNTAAVNYLEQGFTEFIGRQVDLCESNEKIQGMIEDIYMNKIDHMEDELEKLDSQQISEIGAEQTLTTVHLDEYSLEVNRCYEYGKERIEKEYEESMEREKRILWEKIFELYPDQYSLIRKEIERYPQVLWNFATCEFLRQMVIAKEGLSFELSFLIILCYKGIEAYLQVKLGELMPDYDMDRKNITELWGGIEKDQIRKQLEDWSKLVQNTGAHKLTVDHIEEVNEVRQETYQLFLQLCLLFK